MKKIHILPAHIANQIAAGEVVERPASIVKEFLENAIDAGAGRIKVHLEDGGKRLIRVIDDGCGMGRKDLELSVERHATSKIREESDLASIRTMGFRGEALPSIAAVSRLTITSRPEAALEGWRVRVVFGRNKAITAAGCPQGTAVEVEDLFLEIPARLRFLKRRGTELGHVARIIRIFAVSYPEIMFELSSDGRTVFRSRPGTEGVESMWPLAGDDLVRRMISVRGGGGELSVSGYISPPEEGRASSSGFYFFLNKRPVSNRLLWKALNEACRGIMRKGMHPVGALFLEMEPGLVDVNVHPAKQEVRFAQPDSVFRVIYHAVKKAMEHGGELSGQCLHRAGAGEREKMNVLYEQIQAGPGKGRCQDAGSVTLGQAVTEASPGTDLCPLPWETSLDDSRGHTDPGRRADIVRPMGDGEVQARPSGEEDLDPIGQLAGTYVLAQGSNGFVLVDQHAAHEGIIFKRLKREFLQKKNLNSQPLIFPEILERNPEDLAGIKEVSSILSQIGIEAEAFGDSEIAVRAVPEFIASAPGTKKIVTELIDRVLELRHRNASDLMHELLASIACHSAIMAGQKLGRQEMQALLKELSQEGVTRCPHGRRVSYYIGLDEIEKWFGRR